MTKRALDPNNRIADVRKSKGLTQQDLADKVGVHWITISKLERGLIRLSAKWSDALVEALGVDADDLLPINRELTTVDIVGHISPQGVVQRDEEKRRGFVVKNEMFHSSGRMWFEVEGLSLYPMFRERDLLCFEYASDEAITDRIGRFSFVEGTAADGQRVALLGYVTASPYPNKFNVMSISGQISLLEIELIAPLVMAIYDTEPTAKGDEQLN